MAITTTDPFDPHRVATLQGSFAQVSAGAERAAVGRRFYDRLFAEAPDLRPMFGDDLDAQGMKLMDMVNLVVAGLSHVEALLPIAEDLAHRHVDYGVRPGHYPLVGRVLIATLDEAVGPRGFEHYARECWEGAYAALADAMIAAAYPEPAAPVAPGLAMASRLA